jgi:hypothetical protein
MTSAIRNRLSSLAVQLLLLPFLGACSLLQTADQTEDPRIAQLLGAMDQCLTSQETTSAQLQRQEEQLGRQSEQLHVLGQGLAADRAREARSSGEVGTAPIAAACIQPVDEPAKMVVGELEQVWLPNLQLALPARIDTGAETASLDARNVELFERNGRRWVRFEILHPETGAALVLERKLKRMVAILQATSSEAERRPVIKLGVTIGHINQTAEFTLSNRSHLDYQLLIGRNILQDVMVVDVSKKNVAPYVIDEQSVFADEAAQ